MLTSPPQGGVLASSRSHVRLLPWLPGSWPVPGIFPTLPQSLSPHFCGEEDESSALCCCADNAEKGSVVWMLLEAHRCLPVM